MKKLVALVAALAAVTVANVGIHFVPNGSAEEKPAAPSYGDQIGSAKGCPITAPIDFSTWQQTAYMNDAGITIVCTPPIATGPAQ